MIITLHHDDNSLLTIDSKDLSKFGYRTERKGSVMQVNGEHHLVIETVPNILGRLPFKERVALQPKH